MKIDDPHESINLLVCYMVVEFSICIYGKFTSKGHFKNLKTVNLTFSYTILRRISALVSQGSNKYVSYRGVFRILILCVLSVNKILIYCLQFFPAVLKCQNIAVAEAPLIAPVLNTPLIKKIRKF